jgi:hypothetical protein
MGLHQQKINISLKRTYHIVEKTFEAWEKICNICKNVSKFRRNNQINLMLI